jgi:hypothetical protein
MVIGWLRGGVKPVKKKDYADPAIAVDQFGNFELCPTEPFRKGAVQETKVLCVTHRRYVKAF